MIIRPKRSAGLFMALIIEFIMIPFYIYAVERSLKIFSIVAGGRNSLLGLRFLTITGFVFVSVL